jgi:hypothetical protein
MNQPSRPFLVRSLQIPKRVWAMAVLLCLSSFAQFAHHAEFLASYPNSSDDLTREELYLAWLALTAVGMLAGVCNVLGRGMLAAIVLALYGFLGAMAGVGQYAQGFWDEHPLAANATICLEALCGIALTVRALRTASQTPGRKHGSRRARMLRQSRRRSSY